MKTLPNEPMHPTKVGGGTQYFHNGLTKLEYAAIQAMKGILANGSSYYCKRADFVAEISVKYAKALFNELNKEQ